MRHSILLRFFATLLSIITTTGAFAYDFEVDGIYYKKLSDDVSVKVTYKDANYNSYSGAVTIPSQVTYNGTTYSITEIGNYAFYDCSGLTSVTIPNSVTSIGSDAFSWCTGLTSVTIPNSVNSIGDLVFGYCSGLYSVTIGNSVTSIGDSAFFNCSGLTSVTIPNSVATIGDFVFHGCSGLTSVTIPNSVTSIGSDAFSGCTGLTSVTIPNSVTEIGNSPFSGCTGLEQIVVESGNTVYDSRDNCNAIIETATDTLINGCKSTVIPNSVTSIGDYALYYCRSLTSVTIPNSVISIGSGAFIECTGLTSVTIPNSVTSIGVNAFYGCSGLKQSAYPEHLSNPFSDGRAIAYSSDDIIESDGSIYSSDKSVLIFVPSHITNYTIPNSVTSIGDYAFYFTGLSSITIGNSVTSIGDKAFYGCIGLSSVTISSSVTSIGTDVFSQCNITKVIWLPKTPPSGSSNVVAKVHYVVNDQYNMSNQIVYQSLSSLFTVDGTVFVPVDISERTCDAIDCTYSPEDKSIVITDKVSYKGIEMNLIDIKPYTYYENPYIESIEIAYQGNIGDYAFQYCSTLNTATIANKVSIGKGAFSDCSALTTATLGEEVTSIGDRAFYKCSSLAAIAIPNSVTSLGFSAFYGCSALETATIGTGVTSLPWGVFNGCSSLASLTIPANVTSIGHYAFEGCSAITDLTMEDGENAITLGYNGSSPLFADCPLEEVYIGRKLAYTTTADAGYSPFYGNTSLRTVEITDAETQIYDNEFNGCSNLQSLTIGDGVTTIGNWAFSGCSALKNFSVGSMVESIGEEAFSGCTGLTGFTIDALTPPVCGNQALYDIKKWECSLCVPLESQQLYKNADQWKEFFFIVSGIEDIIVDNDGNGNGNDNGTNNGSSIDDAEPVEYYNLQGIRVENPTSGVYIRRQGSSTTKVSIK